MVTSEELAFVLRNNLINMNNILDKLSSPPPPSPSPPPPSPPSSSSSSSLTEILYFADNLPWKFLPDLA
jgi:hypothetical protein